MTIGDLFGWAFLIVLCLFGGWIAWQMFLHPHREALPYLGRDLAKAYLWHSRLTDVSFFTYVVAFIPLIRLLTAESLGLAEREKHLQFFLLLYSVSFMSYWAYYKFAPYPRQLPTNPVVRATGFSTSDFDTETDQSKESSQTATILVVLFWGAVLTFPFYYVFIRNISLIVSDPYSLLSRLLLALSASLLVSIEASPWRLVIGEDGVNINGRFMAWERFGHWLWNPIPKQESELLLVNPTMSRLWRIPLDAQYRTAVEDALEQRLGRPHLPHLENE